MQVIPRFNQADDETSLHSIHSKTMQRRFFSENKILLTLLALVGYHVIYICLTVRYEKSYENLLTFICTIRCVHVLRHTDHKKRLTFTLIFRAIRKLDDTWPSKILHEHETDFYLN